MLGNTAQSHIAEPSSASVSLQVVLSAQALGELSALCHVPESDHALHQELAGILFGIVIGDSVMVETVRQLPPSDGAIFHRLRRREFEDVIRSSHADHSLDSFQIVGWYRFHDDGELQLEHLETTFHENLFPATNHLGLVVRPEQGAGMSMLVCARSQDGAFSRTQHCSATVVVNARRIARQTVDLRAGPTFAEEAYIQAYRMLDGTQPPSRRRWLIWGVVAFAILTVAAVYLKLTAEPPTAPPQEQKAPPLSLMLSGEGSNLLVSWIGGVASPKTAHLKIFDGDSVSDLDLTKGYTATGSVRVARHSGNLQVVITVTDGAHRWQSQSALLDGDFRSTQRAHDDLAAVSQTSEDQAALNALRRENQRLQQTVNSLRKNDEFAPYKPHRGKK